MPGGTTRMTVDRIPTPLYMSKGEGAYAYDVDGRRFLDLVGDYTVLLHGHNFAPVVDAVRDQISVGSCYANPTELEVELAELLCERIPAIEKVRFVTTGTEAVMFAIKAARAFTGRTRVLKFEGCYHGGYDWAEASENNAPENWGEGRPTVRAYAAGTPEYVLDDIVVGKLNDAELLRDIFAEQGDQVACILLDPMPSRAGLFGVSPEFVEAIHVMREKYSCVLICDEVLSLRVAYHGSSSFFGLSPDLITVGKTIGGGLPIGAIGGSSELMSVFSSENGSPEVPQGGTFSANPISLCAGIAAVRHATPEAYANLSRLNQRLQAGLSEAFKRTGARFSVTGLGSLFRIHPKDIAPKDYRSFHQSPEERNRMRELSNFLFGSGIWISPLTSACLSTPMGNHEISQIVEAVSEFCQLEAK